MTIKQLTDESIALLKDMIAIPSPSFGETAVCDHICSWLNQRNVSHERVGNNIIAEHIHTPGMPVLMFCAHIDTVLPCEGYGFDPYVPDPSAAAETINEDQTSEYKAGDIIAGLGSNDDGASAVAMIAAYRYLTQENQNKKEIPNLTLVLTCEEERSGKDGMTHLWPNRLNRIKYAIIGEPTGMRVATSERGLLVIDAEAHGISGHAGNNEGENAIYIAIQDIKSILSHEFTRRSPLMGKVNVNITQINAGTAHNIIPDRCRFVIDIRPTEQYTNREILDELKGCCRSTLTPRNLENHASATREDSPLLKTAESLGMEMYSSPTTSDWMRIDCDAIKMGPGDSCRSHKKNEFVLVKEIEEGIKTYIDFTAAVFTNMKNR